MGASGGMRFLLLVAAVAASGTVCAAQLRRNHYAGVCPDVESIVRGAVTKKFQQTFITVGALVHLYFHDCFVEGCDASVLIASTANNTAEKDATANLSLAGDGFDTVIKAKAALDAVPRCRNQVSCADILTMATRDAIALAGGPAYAVELGRLDGLHGGQRSGQARAADVQPRQAHGALRLQRALADRHDRPLRRAHGGTGPLQHVRQPAASDRRPDAEPKVRGPAAVVVPAERGRAYRRAHGHGDAAGLRQPVLQEPADRNGPAELRPAVLHRCALQAHRGCLGQERGRFRPGLRDSYNQDGPRRGQDCRVPGEHTPQLRCVQLKE